MHTKRCEISVFTYSIDASKTKTAASMSNGRMEVFLAIFQAVTEAKFAATLFADSAVISIAYLYKQTSTMITVLKLSPYNM